MSYTIAYTNRFKKDYKKMVKRNYPIPLLKTVVLTLANNEKLAEKYRDHILIDDKTYQNVRECHILPDWLLIYQIKDSEITLIRTGTHSDLF